MLWIYLKTGRRNLSRNKITTIINILGLAIGIALSSFVFLWVMNELSYDRYHPASERIFRTTALVSLAKGDRWKLENSPLPLADVAKSQIPDIAGTARILPFTREKLTLNILGRQWLEREWAYVDTNWFRLFHYDFVDGNDSRFVKDPYSVILTESKAALYFGKQPAIGKVVQIDSVYYTVQGIIKDNPTNSSFQYSILIPIGARLKNAKNLKSDNNWANLNYITFVKLNRQARPDIVAKKLTELFQDNAKNTKIAIELEPLREMHFESDLKRSALLHTEAGTLNIFILIAVALLLIACVNYVNITTARSSLRAREVGVKKILGASRNQLMKQFVTESVLTSFFAFISALAMVILLLPFFNSITWQHFTLASFTSPTFWGTLLAIMCATLVLNSIYPAVVLSAPDAIIILQGDILKRVSSTGLRKGLIIIQFSISGILIFGTIVIIKQMNFTTESSTVYNSMQTIQFSMPPHFYSDMHFDKSAIRSKTEALKRELLMESSIEDVSVTSNSLIDLNGMASGIWDWPGRNPEFDPAATQLSTDANFKGFFNLSMKKGRWFLDNDQEDEHNFVLNETAIKEFNIDEDKAIGLPFIMSNDTGKIVGIIKDFNYKSLHNKIDPLIISNRSGMEGVFYVKIRPGRIGDGLQAIKDSWARLSFSTELDYIFVDEGFNNLYKKDRLMSLLVDIFAFTAILISSLGLSGLVAFTTKQRAREMSIRKVLGGNAWNIALLLLREFTQLVVIAILFSWPIGWWLMHTWLQDFYYRVNIHWWIFPLSAVISLLAAMMTISVQTFKVAIANPVKNLRS